MSGGGWAVLSHLEVGGDVCGNGETPLFSLLYGCLVLAAKRRWRLVLELVDSWT